MNVEHRELISISPQVNVEIDPILENCLKTAFVWANEMGIKGIKISPFNIRKGSEELFCDPRAQRHAITCKIFHEVPNEQITQKDTNHGDML